MRPQKYRIERYPVTQPSNKSIRLIPLTQGQNAIVDAADYDWLNKWNWYAAYDCCVRGFYAHRHGNVAMHRVILGCSKREQADHKNRNTLDNRRCNLRKVTHAENQRNRIGRHGNRYIGITWSKEYRKWVARIMYKGKSIWLGRYHSKKEAALIRDQAARKLFDKITHLNFPHICT